MGVSAARLYCENKLALFEPKGVKIPVGANSFPNDPYCTPKSWAERAFAKLVYYKEREKGRHFGAWEQPQFRTEDVRATFKSLR